VFRVQLKGLDYRQQQQISEIARSGENISIDNNYTKSSIVFMVGFGIGTNPF
jgi:hypothetical protein